MVTEVQWVKQGSDLIQCVSQKVLFGESGEETSKEIRLEDNYQVVSYFNSSGKRTLWGGNHKEHEVKEKDYKDIQMVYITNWRYRVRDGGGDNEGDIIQAY